MKSSPPSLGFLVSASVHVILIMILVDRSLASRVLVPETVSAEPWPSSGWAKGLILRFGQGPQGS